MSTDYLKLAGQGYPADENIWRGYRLYPALLSYLCRLPNLPDSFSRFVSGSLESIPPLV